MDCILPLACLLACLHACCSKASCVHELAVPLCSVMPTPADQQRAKSLTSQLAAGPKPQLFFGNLVQAHTWGLHVFHQASPAVQLNARKLEACYQRQSVLIDFKQPWI